MLLALNAHSAISSKTLKVNQWELVSFPIGNSEISFETLIGNSLPADRYKSLWTFFSYSTGEYVTPSLTESPEAGVGHWIIQDIGSEVQLNVEIQNAMLNLDESVSCMSAIGCVKAFPRTTTDDSSWSILETSLPGISVLDDFRVSSRSPNEPCFAGCSLDDASLNIVANSQICKYNGDLQRYE